ncbi:MAG: hypothetical protein K8S98_18710 [Planctomycetes bacterium]|nr:hypothetical protein [Planctomycetota bacterium]
MEHSRAFVFALVLTTAAILLFLSGCNNASGGNDSGAGAISADATVENSLTLIDEGRQTFRFETFGDEAFWGDTLRLHEAIAGTALGGVGAGLSPAQALALGLKVDSEALGAALRNSIAQGNVDFTDPATTLELLKREAVVGVKGIFDGTGRLTSVGIQCAICHSTVDESFQPSMGRRRDGWANRDLDIGSIIALAPNLAPVSAMLGTDDVTVRTVLHAWGPGKFDAQVFLDGKAFQPGGGSAATLIPPAFGLGGVNLHTWTGWGSGTYWNAFVANLEMHGQGTFYDPRLDDPLKFPVAAAENSGHTKAAVDLITPKLAALQFYQLALPIPVAPVGSFDAGAAVSGGNLFRGAARCSECHVPPLYTEPGWNMHTANEIGIDDFQALRSPDERYRTAPLRGLFTHATGGYYHDGRFATLLDVVEHYDAHFALALTQPEKSDLVEFLKSL